VRGVLARWSLGERSVLLHRLWESRNRSPSNTALHGVRRAALGTGRLESLRAVWGAALRLASRAQRKIKAGTSRARGTRKLAFDRLRKPSALVLHGRGKLDVALSPNDVAVWRNRDTLPNMAFH